MTESTDTTSMRSVAPDSRIASFGIADDCGQPREHAESEADGWPPFEVDRRRVIASSAFRRLQYKTQVFVAPGDHFRTRLTHTLEVASVARRLALGLGLNATLAEVVALAHDVGHPPFGHAGERALNDMMAQDGGFEHNAQSLRVVEYLEHPFPAFRGLNLTLAVREALARHHTAYDQPGEVISTDPRLNDLLHATPTGHLEGQVADVADRVAYDCHDLEDALGAGILDLGDVQGLALWARCATPVIERHRGASLFAIWRPVVENIQRHLLNDVITHARAALANEDVGSVDAVRARPRSLIAFSEPVAAEVSEVETFLRQRVYGHAELQDADRIAADQVKHLFATYLEHPDRLPARFAARIGEQSAARVVCDYIAGMTDRFCAQQAAP